MKALKLQKSEFNFLKEFIYKNIGISLSEQKIYLVQGRLNKRLKQLHLNSFEKYCDLLRNDRDGEELTFLSTLISTNVTSFFREPSQWRFLESNIESILNKAGGRLRVWSAASSTGEEPYSISMFIKEHEKNSNVDVKILATDISTKVLKQAQSGRYKSKALASLDRNIHTKYFSKVANELDTYSISHNVKKDVTFRMFNLVTGDYNIFAGKKFDMIFCRNVMIYFDKTTQNTLVEKFHTLLKPGGYLFIGSSEALTDIKKGFKLVNASIYQKV